MKYNMIYGACFGCLDFLRSFMAWWSLWIEIDYWIYYTITPHKHMDKVGTWGFVYSDILWRDMIKNDAELCTFLLQSQLHGWLADWLTDWYWSSTGFTTYFIQFINIIIQINDKLWDKKILNQSQRDILWNLKLMFISCKKSKCSQNLFIFFVPTVASCIQITDICYLILTPSMGVNWLS